MENDKKREENSAHLEARSKEVREKILAGYKTLVENISETHFNPIQELIEKQTNKKIELDRSVQIFKVKLYERIEKKFLDNWKECELDKSLAHLEFSKGQTENDEKKWRPTTECVEEQMRPDQSRELQRRKNFLQRQVNFQDKMIEDLIPQVEQFRRQFLEQSRQNKLLLEDIESDKKNFDSAEEKTKIVHQALE